MNASSIKHLPAKLLLALTLIIASTINSAQNPADAVVDIDIDGNGNLDALTDGLLSLRWMFGLNNTALTDGVIGSGAVYTTSTAIDSRLISLGNKVDIDSDGEVDALTDGLLILRYLFGLRGDSLIAGALSEGSDRSTVNQIEEYMASISGVGAIDLIDLYYGTKTPNSAPAAPDNIELIDSNTRVYGQLEGLTHEPTAAPGAGKFVFNRVYRSFKHGLEYGQQFGVFGSWLGSFGNNSIEGGLWVNPKTAGPHYYPTLHLAGVGDTYHACNDVQMGSGLYERVIGDKWLTMIQISNKVLTVPGVNIAFDMEQQPFENDNGIWIGSGWSYLNLNHPREFKFWMSFIESYDYQGPINGYMPEHFNWIDPDKISDGRYAQNRANYGNDFGTFATRGSSANWGNGNERIGLSAYSLGDDRYYVPVANLPDAKEREYLLAHPQRIEIDAMENFSAALRTNNLTETLIPSEDLELINVYQSTHNQLKLIEDIAGQEHRFMIVPSYSIGFDNLGGFVQWDHSTEAAREAQRQQNGYLYVRKLTDKWVVEDGASDDYKNHPHSYQTELIAPPDDLVRVPRVNHRFFNYKERDTSHPDFNNWDTNGKTRYQKVLQNGSVATYVWFKFIEQPAVKTAQQNHPEIYTETYLEELQSYIETLHTTVNQNSQTNPSDPVFINYRGGDNPEDQAPHLARLDPGQLVEPESGFELGYVPVVISVYHPQQYSDNGVGILTEPHADCSNGNWTNSYHPDIE
ncbi:MAG: hypothetical protein P8Q91_05750 [Porticoccaceae bacterium]|nr:hypothetical protein [Porticoccaceae bacterium]